MSIEIRHGWSPTGTNLHDAIYVHADEDTIAGWVAYCRDDRLQYLVVETTDRPAPDVLKPCPRCARKRQNESCVLVEAAEIERLQRLAALAEEARRIKDADDLWNYCVHYDAAIAAEKAGTA